MKTTTSPLKSSDAAKLLRIEDKRDRLLFACALFLGLRGTSELSRLKWKDLMGEHAMIYQPKTGKYREIMIVPKLREIISWAYDGQPLESYIFTGRRGSFGDKPITNAGLNKIIRRYFRILGITTRLNDSSHALRKTFGRNYWESNGKTMEAAEWLRRNFGHASIHTTLIYIGIDYHEQGEKMKNINYV